MKPLLSQGLYRIEYDNGIVQEKHLIKHIDYVNIIKRLIELRSALVLRGLDDVEEKLDEQVGKLLIPDSDYWFTDESPIYLNKMYGDIKCTIKKIG